MTFCNQSAEKLEHALIAFVDDNRTVASLFGAVLSDRIAEVSLHFPSSRKAFSILFPYSAYLKDLLL
ncbi:MAG: hypothetical protein AAF171_25140 [Cyanobacteria bacterium P01_A01_bin.116]